MYPLTADGLDAALRVAVVLCVVVMAAFAARAALE
jgi:hypothetical protein